MDFQIKDNLKIILKNKNYPNDIIYSYILIILPSKILIVGRLQKEKNRGGATPGQSYPF
jgi:hypothetical protein